MADIFLSYASNDREQVRSLVEALEANGYSVWWDTRIELGSSFDREIETQLEQAAVVIVVWSASSVDSDWVREEAGEALERDKLLPVRIDGCRVPLGFRRAQTADLHGWPVTGPGLQTVLTRLAEVLGPRGAMASSIAESHVTPDEIVIAVLPFTNINAEADTDGLCAGIAEAITGALVKLPGLRVRTYTQALQYSSQDMGSSDIGRQLGAEMVLEGSLQSIQGRVAVTIRLVKVGSSDAIWSERMVRDTQDVFALQEEVASQAVDGLRSELGFYRSPEALVVGFARTGDSNAFAELVKRRQSWIRNLMRRCCGDVTLADDLAQQVFFQAWRKISSLREANRFGPWLKRLAVNVWLQHSRANDALRDADDYSEADAAHNESTGISMDLNRALATLSDPVRLCIVLSYHEGMTHGEIADMVDLPLGTVKSHIRRGTQRLQELLSAYVATPSAEEV